MALQTNLSKKDKSTIAILLFAAVVFMIIWFLIRPTITTIRNTEEKIVQAELKQTENKNKIILLSSSEALYEKAVYDLQDSTAVFYEIMDSAEIDRMVTSYVLKSGLFAEDLIINMPAGSVNEYPYIYSSLNDNENKSSVIDTSEDNITTSSNTTSTVEGLNVPYSTAKSRCNSTESSGVQCVSLELVCTGSQRECQAFIDDISSKPAVRVTGFTWSKVDPIEVYNEETGRYDKKDTGMVRLTLDINLYMVDIVDYSTVFQEPAV